MALKREEEKQRKKDEKKKFVNLPANGGDEIMDLFLLWWRNKQRLKARVKRRTSIGLT